MNFLADDQIPFLTVPSEIEFEDLLEKPAFFKLKSALRLLTIEVSAKYQEVLAERKKMEAEEREMKMGILKIGSTWWFYPPAFKKEYLRNVKLQAKKPPKNWDRKTFFREGEGLYYMADVCNRYFPTPHPLNVHALRKMVAKNEKTMDTRSGMGVFRIDARTRKEKNHYFIQMPVFGLWVGRFSSRSRK